MTTSDQTINLPQLIFVLILGGLAVRFLFFSSDNNSSSSGGSSSRNNAALRAREADVERVSQMFPQLARRHIMWDLQRNGGNVVATTERVLSGRGLEVPPVTYQPALPPPENTSTGAGRPSSSRTPERSQPDLITRYNLSDKLGLDNTGEKVGGSNGKQVPAWSQNKTERQALLQKRREDMILAARRKMEAKVKGKGMSET